MKKIFLLFAFMFTFFYGFSQEKDIEVLLEQQKVAWNNGNISAYMQGYWKSDSLLFVGRSGPHRGWTRTLENYQKSYPDKSAMGHLTFDILEVKMVDEHHAFVLGGWNLKREQDELHGFFTLLLKRFGSDWKIIVDHSS